MQNRRAISRAVLTSSGIATGVAITWAVLMWAGSRIFLTAAESISIAVEPIGWYLLFLASLLIAHWLLTWSGSARKQSQTIQSRTQESERQQDEECFDNTEKRKGVDRPTEQRRGALVEDDSSVGYGRRHASEPTMPIDQENLEDSGVSPLDIDNESDRDIQRAVTDFQNGINREDNFRFLYEKYREPTSMFLARRVSSFEERERLTQETFLRVYRGLEGYRGEGKFGTWVFRIAFNQYLRWLRQKKADKVGSEATVPLEVLSLDRTLQEERRQALRSALEGLPEQMRRCAELRIYHDLSYHEIAMVMYGSIETVKANLLLARKKLRESFGDIDLVRRRVSSARTERHR